MHRTLRINKRINKIRNIQAKTPVMESLFNKVAGLQLFYEYSATLL